MNIRCKSCGNRLTPMYFRPAYTSKFKVTDIIYCQYCKLVSKLDVVDLDNLPTIPDLIPNTKNNQIGESN